MRATRAQESAPRVDCEIASACFCVTRAQLEHIEIEPVGFSSETHAKIMNHRGYRTDYQSWRQGKAQGAKGEPTSERLLDSLGIDARPLKENGSESMSKGWPQARAYERTEPSDALASEVRAASRWRRECSWSDACALTRSRDPRHSTRRSQAQYGRVHRSGF